MEKDKKVLARVYGIVQGVGFRPTVSRHAARCQVRGSVCNKGPYVEIKAQGTQERVNAFLHEVEFNPPERSSILKMDVHPLDDAEEFSSFEIIESEGIAFDHAAIIGSALSSLRKDVLDLEMLFDFLPEKFTLLSLQLSSNEYMKAMFSAAK